MKLQQLLACILLFLGIQTIYGQQADDNITPIENCMINYAVYSVRRDNPEVRAAMKQGRFLWMHFSGETRTLGTDSCQEAYNYFLNWWKKDWHDAVKSDMYYTIYNDKKGKDAGRSDFVRFQEIFEVLEKADPSIKK